MRSRILHGRVLPMLVLPILLHSDVLLMGTWGTDEFERQPSASSTHLLTLDRARCIVRGCSEAAFQEGTCSPHIVPASYIPTFIMILKHMELRICCLWLTSHTSQRSERIACPLSVLMFFVVVKLGSIIFPFICPLRCVVIAVLVLLVG